MNFRKSINLIQTIILLTLCLIVFDNPAIVSEKAIIYFSFLILMASICLGYEYFFLIRRKKIFLINAKVKGLHIDSVTKTLCIVIFAAGFIINFSEVSKDAQSSFLFSAITTVYGFLYHRLRMIKLEPGWLLFYHLDVRDKMISELKEVKISTDKKEIHIILINEKEIILKISPDYYEKDPSQILRITKYLNESIRMSPAEMRLNRN